MSRTPSILGDDMTPVQPSHGNLRRLFLHQGKQLDLSTWDSEYSTRRFGSQDWPFTSKQRAKNESVSDQRLTWPDDVSSVRNGWTAYRDYFCSRQRRQLLFD